MTPDRPRQASDQAPGFKPCAICRTADHVHVYLSFDRARSDTRHEHDDARHRVWAPLLECLSCGLIYVNEPTRQNRAFALVEDRGDLETQWRAQYPDDLDVYDEDSWGRRFTNASKTVRWQYAAVHTALGDDMSRGGYVLTEVGAARGHLIAELKRRHPTMHVVGIEPSPIMAAHVRRVADRTVAGVIEDGGFEDESVDAFVGFGSFIQVRDPGSALRYMNRVLRPGGRILLDSPNQTSLVRALARLAYRLPRLPRRLQRHVLTTLRLVYNPHRYYYYSPETFSRLLEATGFTVTSVSQRQARYLQDGMAAIALPLRAAAATVSIAERLTGRQAWVQICGLKPGGGG